MQCFRRNSPNILAAMQMISISADRRSQLAGRVAGKRSGAVFVGTQLEIPVLIVVGSPDLDNPMMLQRGPIHCRARQLHACHVAHVERASRRLLESRPRFSNDNSSCHHLPSRVVIRSFLWQQLDAQEPSRTTATVPRNRPRQAALSSCRHSRVSHRESPPERPRRVVVVTSAPINGTLDVTRRPNFPDKPLSQPRGTFALRLTDTRSAVDVDAAALCLRAWN